MYWLLNIYRLSLNVEDISFIAIKPCTRFLRFLNKIG